MPAVFPKDHGGVSMDFIIEKCRNKQCERIPLHNDSMVERDEVFSVSLERTTGLDERIMLHNDYEHKKVTIVDDDGEWLYRY